MFPPPQSAVHSYPICRDDVMTQTLMLLPVPGIGSHASEFGNIAAQQLIQEGRKKEAKRGCSNFQEWGIRFANLSWKLTDSVASCSTQILKERWRHSGRTLLLLLIVLGISSRLAAVSLVCPCQYAMLHFVNLSCHTGAITVVDYYISQNYTYFGLIVFFNWFRISIVQITIQCTDSKSDGRPAIQTMRNLVS